MKFLRELFLGVAVIGGGALLGQLLYLAFFK